MAGFFEETIRIYEARAREDADESSISINLFSEYFEFDEKDMENDEKMDRAERRFNRYCEKKHKSQKIKGTLLNATEMDSGEHPALSRYIEPKLEKCKYDLTHNVFNQ